jgi:hypothetical protein
VFNYGKNFPSGSTATRLFAAARRLYQLQGFAIKIP